MMTDGVHSLGDLHAVSTESDGQGAGDLHHVLNPHKRARVDEGEHSRHSKKGMTVVMQQGFDVHPDSALSHAIMPTTSDLCSAMPPGAGMPPGADQIMQPPPPPQFQYNEQFMPSVYRPQTFSPEFFSQMAQLNGMPPARGGAGGLGISNQQLMLYQGSPQFMRPAPMGQPMMSNMGGIRNMGNIPNMNQNQLPGHPVGMQMQSQLMDPRLAQVMQNQFGSMKSDELMRLGKDDRDSKGSGAIIGSSKKVPKLKSLRDISVADWRRCIQKACNIVFHRLELRGFSDKRDSILARIEKSNLGEWPEHASVSQHPCYLVQRENFSSKSPFQVQVSGARILAQKIIFAAYRCLDASDMGTWQVQQKCLHPDGTWWCFEPSHLEKCERDHVPSNVKKHPIPFAPDAIYVARNRHTQHPVVSRQVSETNQGAETTSAEEQPRTQNDENDNDSVSPQPTSHVTTIFERLGLPTGEYEPLCKDSGIDTVEDFLLFSEKELQSLGFKLAHVKRIFSKLGKPVSLPASPPQEN